jgi:putative spermidine/putrescine transport system ATP-binding protein
MSLMHAAATGAIAGGGDALVAFTGVEKTYGGNVVAVRRLDFAIARGEFLTFLGPSGSGKTTTLNMLAGFERPTAGSITLDGRSVDGRPPYERNIGMVFQNYALFPHMSVAENVAFPLSVRKVAKSEITDKVARALAMVHLAQFGERRPAQLSGGQQQRVALARALVFEPSLVLMDEPLGALDKKLREHMQIEIKHLHEMLGVTVVYVTHDQSEALTMSDRVAVFNNGEIAQIGSPEALYNEPASVFVANFIGESNTLSGAIETVSANQCKVALGAGVSVLATAVDPVRAGDRVNATVRPERIVVSAAGAENATPAKVEDLIYFGDHKLLLTRLDSGQLVTASVGADAAIAHGEIVGLAWSPADCRVFSASPDDEVATPRRRRK